MNLKEAMKRIEELEKRVRELETRPAQQVHYHYHTQPHIPQPTSPYYVPWSQPMWGGIGSGPIQVSYTGQV